jgi:hypothetical protein
MARPSTLEGRVLAIVDETRDRRPAGRAAAVASAFVIVATLSLSALAQVASEAPAAPVPTVPGAAAQIQIDAKFIEVGAGKSPEAKAGSVTTKSGEQAAAMLRELGLGSGVDLLSAPRIITTSGQAAHIYIGNEEKLPEGAQPPTKSVGITLDVVPTLAGGAIQLDAKAKLVSRRATPDAGGAPVFTERTAAANVSLRPGQSLVFGAARAISRIAKSWSSSPRASSSPAPPPARLPFQVSNSADGRGKSQRRPRRHRSSKTSRRASATRTPQDHPSEARVRDATVDEAVEFLRRKSRDLDPAGRGINLVLKADKETSDRRLSLSLVDIPLSEAVRYVASLADLEVVYEPHAIVLRRRSPARKRLRTQPSKSTRTKRVSRMASPWPRPCETHHGNSRVSADKLRYDPASRRVRTKARPSSNSTTGDPKLVGSPALGRGGPPLAIEAKANAIIIPSSCSGSVAPESWTSS